MPNKGRYGSEIPAIAVESDNNPYERETYLTRGARYWRAQTNVNVDNELTSQSQVQLTYMRLM